MRALLLPAAAVFAACAACGGGEGAAPPVWRSLAAGFEPARSLPAPGPWGAAPELFLSPAPDGAGWWVEETLRASGWSGSSRVWTALASIPGVGRPADGAPQRTLAAGERSFRFIARPSLADIADPERVPAASTR